MNSTHFAPFFAEHPRMSQGLNLLGYKGICETLYTTLLPGLNAVTSRIRYYSFYCWLLSELPNQVSPISEKSYVAYIRKAEYLLALIHAQMNNGEGVTGIPGIDKAIVNFKEAGEQISLIEGIYKSDGVSTAGTYWKNKGGVLAQYYLASMSDDMGLLEATNEKASIRNISRKDGFINGAKLAESFKASIGDTDANLFLAAVKSGSVSKTELGQLRVPFYMKGFHNGESEKKTLIDLIFQADRPRSGSETALRKQTITHFLEYVESGAELKTDDSLDFSGYLYDKFIDGESSDICTIGWYLYWLNDNWQYQLNDIFIEILGILEDTYDCCWAPIHELSRNLAEQMTSVLLDKENPKVRDLYILVKSEDAQFSQQNTPEAICADSFLDILYRVSENENCRPADEDYYKVFKIAGNRNTFFKFMDDFLTNLDMDLVDYLTTFLEERIIYKHYAESMRKWANGGGVATHKFMLENGCIRFLDKTYSSHTSPRIRTLKGFLIDLGLVDPAGGLTDDGKTTLELLTA